VRVRVQWDPEARLDAHRAAAWWKRNRRKAPGLFRRELEEALALLRSAPEIGSPVEVEGVQGARRVVLQRSQFLLYYVFDQQAGRVEILAVVNAQREEPPRLRLVR